MSLKDTFSKYSLTNGQVELLNLLDDFLINDEKCFILKGYAGTGKTFMMQGLTDYLAHIKRNFKIAAPTGRAAKVISKKTKKKAYTIHKTIYSHTDIKEFRTENHEGTETFKFYYNLSKNEDSVDTIYIIDESSMISDVYSEGEFFRFGSGYLLRDLVQYINAGENNIKRKILFIGDDAQLAPYNMNISPALNKEYLKSVCSLNSTEYQLTEVVRQKENSGILNNATKLRELIKNNVFNKLELDFSSTDVKNIHHDELLSEYIKSCGNQINDESIIIAYSNASVKQYNDLVRSHFFPSFKEITTGDKILLVANNYNYGYELLNGDFGVIQKTDENVETRVVKLKKIGDDGKLDEIPITIKYRDVEIIFHDLDDKPFVLTCKIIENLLYTSQRDISSDEQKAIYIDFWIRNPKLNKIKQLLHAKEVKYEELNNLVRSLSPNDINSRITDRIKELGDEYFSKASDKKIRDISIFILKDALKSDPYFNALRIKFGYAVTCHKAQGGEWTNTFLNCKSSEGYMNSNYYRWLYTGITRAKDDLYVIDAPNFDIDSKLVPPKIDNLILQDDIIVINSKLFDNVLPFDFSNQPEITKLLFIVLFDLLKGENIIIEGIRHTNYLEHYTFSRENQRTVIKIGYNGKNKITSLLKGDISNEFSEYLFTLLGKVLNKTIECEVSQVALHNFEFPNNFLKDFYDKIKGKLEPHGFLISNIEHSNYHEIYEIRKDGLMATYKFWYDGKNIFKKTEIIPRRTTGLVDEINELL